MIEIKMTDMCANCPNADQKEAVSWTTRPVTQTAETEVKSAVSKEAQCPFAVEKGSIRSRVPTRMTARKPQMMI